jgi:uncharacterized protein (DUF885 family)
MRSEYIVSPVDAHRIVDDAWEELQRSPFVQRQLGVTPKRLPDVSFAEARRRSEVGRSLIKRLDALSPGWLAHDLALSLRLVRFRASAWSREAEWYWTAIDPLGVGCFGLFLPTAYCGGWLLNVLNAQLASFKFEEASDADHYLALVSDYARLIDQFTERTAGQAERDVYMPRAQVEQAKGLLAACRAGALAALGVAPERLAALRTDHFAAEVQRRITSSVEPAFDRAKEGLSDAYLVRAPEAVGLGQYPGGAALYAELVKLHTTMDLSPEQVHAKGHQRMTEIERQMRGIETELGFGGEARAFLSSLHEDPRWRANTVEDITTVFQRYIDRLKPRLEEAFLKVPQTSYGVAPLAEALQGSMTFGLYEPPSRNRRVGLYRFNAANLKERALHNIGALTYHELMPGHHLHYATQQENSDLHPFRSNSFVNAYAEGWAEYAATLAGEMGMYELSEERYGRLVMDALHTSRLVVDTGMNALGWSLEQARDYMRAHSGMGETEIQTESIRYSCDIPGQGLAYKLGDERILAMRERMREALGSRFDLKEFHALVLGPGALPISDLEWHIDREIKRLKDCYTGA